MKIKLVPQMPLKGNSIKYSFKGDSIKATMVFDGETYEDVFDFSEFPKGILMLEDLETGEPLVETELPINPLIHVERENGVLYAEITNWLKSGETDERLLFPEVLDTEECTALLKETYERYEREEEEERQKELEEAENQRRVEILEAHEQAIIEDRARDREKEVAYIEDHRPEYKPEPEEENVGMEDLLSFLEETGISSEDLDKHFSETSDGGIVFDLVDGTRTEG